MWLCWSLCSCCMFVTCFVYSATLRRTELSHLCSFLGECVCAVVSACLLGVPLQASTVTYKSHAHTHRYSMLICWTVACTAALAAVLTAITFCCVCHNACLLGCYLVRFRCLTTRSPRLTRAHRYSVLIRWTVGAPAAILTVIMFCCVGL